VNPTRLAILSATLILAAAAAPSPAAIQVTIAQRGAKAVVAELLQRGQWETVSTNIATGSPAWLALAPQLAPGVDAGPSEELGIDLAYALPKNPTGVLHVAIEHNYTDGGPIGIGRVCSAPFIEPTSLQGYLTQAIRAVGQVTDPAVTSKKLTCLATLSRVEAGRH
jgi:hypothetical protein